MAVNVYISSARVLSNGGVVIDKKYTVHYIHITNRSDNVTHAVTSRQTSDTKEERCGLFNDCSARRDANQTEERMKNTL